MCFYFLILLTTLSIINTAVPNTLWDTDQDCPKSCKCREEHFQDLPLLRYTKRSTNHEDSLSTEFHVSNDVFYEDEEQNENNPLVKVVTCLLPTEIDPKEFILTIPKNTEVLTLLEESGSENKTIYFGYFQHMDDLIGLEIQGLQMTNDDELIKSRLTCVIDIPLIILKYLNLNNVNLKNSKVKNKKLELTEDKENEIEEVVTMMHGQDEILPYNIYKRKQKNSEIPTFIGFKNLILLRVSSCNLQNIYWEMFDGLKNLQHLILENNNLKFIPDFAFYGTPNLYALSLAKNNLLNIQITDLAGLLELEYLDLSCNNFSQLSELSFPPFPKLKLADFQNNPITVIFPNTFDIMNTTDSMVIGGQEIRLELLPNSFLGLNKLVKLKIINVSIPILKREFFNGMPELKELIITGKIDEIEFDAFAELENLEKLILGGCNIHNVSMDSFYGLQNLQVLDLSKNNLKSLPPGVFDQQINLKELLIQGNNLTELPQHIFQNMKSAKLIRLNENPWHCSCRMSDWDPMIINKIKQKLFVGCDARHDKGIGCNYNKDHKYVYENRVAPRCQTPKKYKNLGVFQTMRKELHCDNYKPKIRKAKNIITKKIHLKFNDKINENPTFINKTLVNKNEINNDNINEEVIIPKTAIINQLKQVPNDILNNLNSLKIQRMDNISQHFKEDDKNVKLYKKRKQNLITLAKLRRMKKERKSTSEN